MDNNQRYRDFILSKIDGITTESEKLQEFVSMMDAHCLDINITSYLIGKAASLETRADTSRNIDAITKKEFFARYLMNNDITQINGIRTNESIIINEYPNHIGVYFQIKDKNNFLWGYVTGLLFTWAQILELTDKKIDPTVLVFLRKYIKKILSFIE